MNVMRELVKLFTAGGMFMRKNSMPQLISFDAVHQG